MTQDYPGGFRFQQVVVHPDQLPVLRRSCEAHRVELVEDVKPADADIAKQKRPTTIIVALNGSKLRVAAVRREARV